MKIDADLTYEQVSAELTYDPITGHLRWARSDHGRRLDQPAGGRELRTGYLRVRLGGKRCMAHRVAWMLAYKEWPPHEIDHVNGDTSDNRLLNLRSATPNQNKWNRRKSEGKSTPYKGVCRKARTGRYEAAIRFNGESYYLGTFKTAEKAKLVYDAKAAEWFGEFARS